MSLIDSLILSVVTILAIGYSHYERAKKNRKLEDEIRVDNKKFEEEDRIRKIRDYQLNVGRRVYNLIVQWIKDHKAGLLEVSKVEGDKFSIFVGQRLLSGTSIVILEIKFDFIEKFGKNCEGYIFNAPYGASMYFEVSDWGVIRDQPWLSDLIYSRLDQNSTLKTA